MQQDKNQYIPFADVTVASICATNWGDGVGLTYAQAEQVTSLDCKFRATAIEHFDELKYFTGIVSLNAEEFRWCESLKTLSFSTNLAIIGQQAFQGTKNLQSPIDLPNVTSIGYQCFNDCGINNIPHYGAGTNPIPYFNAPKLQGYVSLLLGGSSVREIRSLGNVSSITYYGLWNTYLKKVKFPETAYTAENFGWEWDCDFFETADFGGLTKYSGELLPYCKSGKALIFRTMTPPSIDSIYSGLSAECKFYAPDDALDTYKGTAPFSNFADRFLPLSEYAD